VLAAATDAIVAQRTAFETEARSFRQYQLSEQTRIAEAEGRVTEAAQLTEAEQAVGE